MGWPGPPEGGYRVDLPRGGSIGGGFPIGRRYATPLAHELAVRVRRSLRQAAMTQKTLAEKVGASEEQVSRVLDGREEGSISFWDALLRVSQDGPPVQGGVQDER